MTFYQPERKFPVAALIILFLVAGVGSVIFFSLKECKASGIFRSGEASDATDLYQVYPYTTGKQQLLISLEGVYKTRLYERQGGITTRSGSTDVRITVHDLKTGEQINRLVLGDYHDSYTKFLGVGKDVLWLYNAKDGIHSRTVSDLEMKTEEPFIVSQNKELSEGFAKSDQYLNNLDELFGYDPQSNALMVTTISGKKVWVDATTFKTVDAPPMMLKVTSLDNMVDEIIQQATQGAPIDIEKLNSKILEMASDLSAFSDIEHESDRVTGFDSCEYEFEGKTVKTIVKSNCPQPQKISEAGQTSGKQFISPVLLSYYNTTNKQYTNPAFLSDAFCVLHAKAIGKNTELMISLVDISTKNPRWTTSSGISLSNERTAYQINGAFGGNDTMFISIDHMMYAMDLKTGKILWKNAIRKGDHYEQLYFIGEATQNNKRFFLTANSYMTELSSDGFFVRGRTDYKLSVIDALNGKTVKKLEVTDSKPGQLPYYLGMSGQQAWFYSIENGIHTRSVPDLKITGQQFSKVLETEGITAGIVKTSGFDDAVESKYVSFDEKNNAVYFTTENGLHYQYELGSGNISEIKAPTDEQYQNYMNENSHVKFFRTRLSYMYHHELFFPDGRSVEFVSNQSTSSLKFNENKKEEAESTTQQLKTNQFIEGQFLVNGVSITGNTMLTENKRTPLYAGGDWNTLYILHKDKISPEAHLMISKYNIENETVSWQFDVTALLLTHGEITRIYTNDEQLIFIFKTHPDLDDYFTCVSINSKTGKADWNFKF